MPKSLAMHTPPLFEKSMEFNDSEKSHLKELSRATIILLDYCSMQSFSALYKFTTIYGKSNLKFNFPTPADFYLDVQSVYIHASSNR